MPQERQINKQSSAITMSEILRGDSCGWGMDTGAADQDEEAQISAVSLDMQDTQFDDDDDFYDRTGTVQKKEVGQISGRVRVGKG